MQTLEQNDKPTEAPLLPLVRLGLILPFVEALDRLGADADAILMGNALMRETVHDPNVFVPVVVINRFLEDAARAIGNPHLGVHVGERLDLAGWPPFVDAVSRATTVGELLIRFIRSAAQEASSARYSLEVGATYSCFREARTREPEIAPAQNDAFMAAITLGLLHGGTGSGWEPERVRLQVCDPAAIPERYLGIRIIGGDRMGMLVRFPTEWLFKAIDPRTLMRESTKNAPLLHVPVAFLDALRQTLLLHLQETDLGVDVVARLSGMSRQSLQRKLKASGTTLSAQIVEVKQQRAQELLVETDQSVVEVATALGFSNPTSFARAFKSWTGVSPRDYRKRARRHTGGDITGK
jgi:AraC-like DNA-binding protein